MYKKCKSCVTWKPFEDFYKCKKAADKHQTHCKVCKSERARQVKTTDPNLTHKTCKKCHTEKLVTEFRKCRVNKDGLRHDCKVCQSEADKAYRQLNKERKLELNRAYTRRNKDKVLAKTRRYQAKKLNRTPEYLTEDDFQVLTQYHFITGFAGIVSNSGMEKLLKNSQVTSISLDRLYDPTQ
jgi:hypothetical protein